jgi:hypothetical protein
MQVQWAEKFYESGLGRVCAICGDRNIEIDDVRTVLDV